MRARSKHLKDMERQRIFKARREEKHIALIRAFQDRNNRETVNVTQCVLNPFELGEVLHDGYGKGSLDDGYSTTWWMVGVHRDKL